MIIIVTPSGNHSNRLFQAIHFESYAIENKFKCYNPTLYNLGFYNGLQLNWYDSLFLFLFRKLNVIINMKVEEFNYENFTYHNPNFKVLDKNIVFVSGWFFFHKVLTLKYKSHFREKYCLSQTIINSVINDRKYNLIDILSKIESADIVFGIHIRRGDYKEWEDGKFFYDDITYQNVINQSKFLFGESKVLYLIFSNELINFNLPENSIVSNNPWYVDHYIMGICDYVIGPPSTFTLWATYIGPKVRYYHMNHKNDFPISLEEFNEYNG